MPKIPTYEVQVTPKSSTDPLLESVEGAGKTFRASNELGKAALARGNQLKKETDIMDASAAVSLLYDQERGFLTGELKRQGSEARGGQERGNQFYKESADKIGGGLSTGARQIFNEKVLQIRNHGLNRLAGHQAQEHQKQKQMTFESSVADVRNQIKMGADEKNVDMMLIDLKNQVSELYKGLDTGKIEQAIEESVLNDFLIEKAGTDPDDIEGLLARYKDKIPEDKQKAIKDLAERIHIEQEVSESYAALNATHGDDFGAMLKDVKGMDLSPKAKSQLNSKVKSEWATDKALKEDTRKKLNEKTGNEVVKMWADKDYQAVREHVLRSEAFTPKQKEHWIDKVDRQVAAELKAEKDVKKTSNPDIYNKISRAINLSPQQVTAERIWAAEGEGGLSAKDAMALTTKLNTLKNKPDQRMKDASNVIESWRKDEWGDDPQSEVDAANLNRMMLEWYEQNPDKDPIDDFLAPRATALKKEKFAKAFDHWERVSTGKATTRFKTDKGGKGVRGKIPHRPKPKRIDDDKFYKEWLGEPLKFEE